MNPQSKICGFKEIRMRVGRSLSPMSEVHNPEASICNGMWPMVHGVREV